MSNTTEREALIAVVGDVMARCGISEADRNAMLGLIHDRLAATPAQPARKGSKRPQEPKSEGGQGGGSHELL